MARVHLNLNPINPIALREMRVRLRGPRTFVLLGTYLTLLGLVIYAVYLRKGGTTPYSYGGTMLGNNFGPTRSYETGQDIFLAIFLYLLVTIAIITPALCAGLVSREIEEGTYNMLVVTPVRGRSLVVGKLLAVFIFLAMLILAAFPFTCLVFLFGGVNFGHIVAGFAIILAECAALCVMSLFFSGLLRRTSLALIVTYCTASLLLLGVPLASNSLMTAINNDTNRAFPNAGYQISSRIDPAFDVPKRMLAFNPFAALGSVLAPNAPYRTNNSDELLYFPNSRAFWGNPNFYFATPAFPPDSPLLAIYYQSKLPLLPGGLSLWHAYLLIYLALTLLFTILAIAVIKPLPRRPGLNPLRGVRLSRPRLPLKRQAKTLTEADPVAILEPAEEAEPLG